MNPVHLPYSLHVTIKEIQDAAVILTTEQQHEIRWPKSQLPTDISVGMNLQLAIVNDDINQKEREKMAKQILNEILNPSKEQK